MPMEQLTIELPAEFKAYLVAEAARQGVSVSDFVRERIDVLSPDDERAVADLLNETAEALADARRSMRRSRENAEAVIAELRAEREARSRNTPPGTATSPGESRGEA
jgi:hypothetical protein